MIVLPFQASMEKGHHIMVEDKVKDFFILGSSAKLKKIAWQHIEKDNDLYVKGYKIIGKNIKPIEPEVEMVQPNSEIADNRSMSFKKRKVRTK